MTQLATPSLDVDTAVSSGAAEGVESATAAFYRSVLPFSGFGEIADPLSFAPLPSDWVIGLADIEASTDAIAKGRYKTVNTAGAAVISALSNALGTLDFPFIFGGDGASFAVGATEAPAAADALAATIAWVGGELGLTLRGAMVPVGEIRAQGLDVRVGRFAASPDVAYAMFSGGGLAWAERRLKAGEIRLPPAPPGAMPDLTGLSCRFQDVKTKHGVILSVLVRPVMRPQDPPFVALVGDILGIADGAPDAGRPIPIFKPMGGVRLHSVAIDGRLQRRPGQSLLASFTRAAAYSVLAAVLLASRRNFRGFSATRYLQEVVANSDFRKYDDGLMLTLDCTPATAARIEERLRRAEQDGVANYGLYGQKQATITCVVPSVMQSNHAHFIDGASGGYAMAAQDLKSRLASGGAL